MEPKIRYAKTADGVSIAYFVVGEGPPIVVVGGGFGMPHVQLAWLVFAKNGDFDALLIDHSMVFYDFRGTGLSERDITTFSAESLVLDLAAVIDAQPVKPVTLLACNHGGPTSIRFAARHPELVSHLILWSTWADADSALSSGEGAIGKAFTQMIPTSVAAFARSLARSFVARGNEEIERTVAHNLREGTSVEAAELYYPVLFRENADAALSDVTSPTLVLQPAGAAFPPPAMARRLAMRIAGAQLSIIESPGIFLMFGDIPEGARAVRAFLGGDAAAPASDITPERSGLRTVLFTDLVGHTEMMQRLGDAKGRDVLREHERITRETLKQHGGTEVKTMGDGFMASFGSVTKAVECAIALQRAFAGHEGEPLSVRVGLNAGEPIEEDGDLFGATVILASRIAAKAEGGEILVADTVRGLCSGKGFLFADRGEFVAKGFEEPVRVFEVRWREDITGPP
jgi:class 3 adenylate cyclase